MRSIALAFVVMIAGYHQAFGEGECSKKQREEIIESIKFAYRLEQSMFQNREKFISRIQVFHHFQQGFSDTIAKRLTEYSWSELTNSLKGHDVSLYPAEKINVLSCSVDTATACYKTPAILRELWGGFEFTIDRVQKIRNRWVIVDSKTSNKQ